MRSPVGVRVHWAANEPQYGRRSTFALARVAISVGLLFRPHVVLALHIRAMPPARLLRRLTGARSMLVIHAKEVPEQRNLARAAMRWADATVAVSAFSRDLALGGGAQPDRVHIIHPGVTLPATLPTAPTDRPGPPTIVTVARMDDRHKGHHLALQAMSRLRSLVPDARWVMVGDGALRSWLEQEAHKLRLGDSVQFTGAVSDTELQRHLSEAHVFCLLSQEPPPGAAGEGFGIVLIEAGANGLPVVAGDVPGVRDAVLAEKTGLLVAPTDAAAVGSALAQLLTDRSLAKRLGEGGMARARELTWPRVAGRYRELLERVVVGPRRDQASDDLSWIGDLRRGPRPA